MRNLYIAVFLFSIFTTSVFAQSKDYTGASSQSSNISASSSPKYKSKSRHSSIKEAQPTNSVTLSPLGSTTVYPALSFKPVAQGAIAEEIVEVAGSKVGDKVILNVPRNAALSGLTWVAWVSRDNEVKVRCTNTSAQTQNLPALEVFKVLVVRK